jgi:transposase
MGKVYTNEYKVMIVSLLNSGRKVKEISEEYELNDSMLRRWKREYEAKAGDFTKKRALSSEEVALKSLRKELRDITLERDILKKAVSIFSKSDR